MFSLTFREQILIAAVLLAVAGGSVIHHLRSRPVTSLSVPRAAGAVPPVENESASAPES